MKTCDLYQRDILLEDSGELEAVERDALSRHLAACPECRRFKADCAWIKDRAPAALERTPVRLNLVLLEKRARIHRATVVGFRSVAALSAIAALFMAFLGAASWLASRQSGEKTGVHQKLALLDEWQFWMGSSVEPSEQGSTPASYLDGWNERDFARHLLVWEGLLPEEEAAVEEEYVEPTGGALPPITLQDYNIGGLLRS